MSSLLLKTVGLAMSVGVVGSLLQRVLAKSSKYSDCPTVGSRFSLLNGIWFMLYPQEMCMEGFEKYGGAPFRVRQQTGWTIVISDPRMADEILRESDELMQPREANDELLQIEYTTGDHISQDSYHNQVIRIGLNRHLPECAADVLDEVVAACEDELPQSKSGWAPVTAYDIATRGVSRAANRLFIGLPTCRDPNYINFTIRITFDIFNAANIINFLPKSLQRFAAPYISKRRRNEREAALYLAGAALERLDNIKKYGPDYTEKPNDFLSWLLEEANTKERREMPDLLSRLMFANFAAILSTGMTLLRSIYDVVRYTEYIPELREEIAQAVESEGFTGPALDKMYKLDSFIRESQRLTPLAPHTMIRRVKRDFTFSNGFSVPAGTLLVLNQTALNLDENLWKDAARFDPFRHIDEAPTNRLISTTNNWLFGHGRHVCAGRSLAVQEIKGILAHIILNYDLAPAKASDFEGGPLPLFKLMSWKVNVRKRASD